MEYVKIKTLLEEQTNKIKEMEEKGYRFIKTKNMGNELELWFEFNKKGKITPLME